MGGGRGEKKKCKERNTENFETLYSQKRASAKWARG